MTALEAAKAGIAQIAKRGELPDVPEWLQRVALLKLLADLVDEIEAKAAIDREAEASARSPKPTSAGSTPATVATYRHVECGFEQHDGRLQWFAR